MDELKQSAGEGMGIDGKSANSKQKNSKAASKSGPGGNEVLLNLPAGFKYKLPGKQQRVIIGSTVLGLNVLLLLAVVLYFYSPAFHDFIYTVGRS